VGGWLIKIWGWDFLF